MLTQAEAKIRAINGFERYARENGITAPTGTDALIFFGKLRKDDPYFQFRCKGDPWQIFHRWLKQARLVND